MELLPFNTPTGPVNKKQWKITVEKAPRHMDNYGRWIIQCAKGLHGPIYCTLDYAQARVGYNRGRGR